MDMRSRLHALMESPEIRRSQHVAYSVSMLGDIASTYDAAVDADDFQLARCMLDAFYVHLRLIADFLVRQTQKRDFGPSDFGVSWVPPNSLEAQVLLGHWKVASTYVVHFGRPRVPENLADLDAFRIGGAEFRRMAGDVLSVFRQFLASVEERASPWSHGPRIPDPGTDPEGWQQRVLAEVAFILRTAHDVAASQIG